MRWLVLALAAVLLVPAPAGAQQAWAKAYEDGVELFEKGGNDALAEQKLIEARNHPRAPKQSRRANFSSVVYRPFIPDFYLGLIYARSNRAKQAQDFLERAVRDELVKPDDRANYALAQTSLQRIRDEQTRVGRQRRAADPAGGGRAAAGEPDPAAGQLDDDADQSRHAAGQHHHARPRSARCRP